MSKLLLLYDTKEKDLARDLKDFLSELDLEVKMIPLSPSKGGTLQEKEARYFAGADGAVFLITPGSVRDGLAFPSPSVSDEMGQARVTFSGIPQRVIYLVDKKCNVQAVDQKSYIQFQREDMRSVLEAITNLVKDLKDSGLYGAKKIERQAQPGVDIEKFSTSISDTHKAICDVMSDFPNGIVQFAEFDKLLRDKFKMRNRDINFAKGDLQTKGLVTYNYASKTPLLSYWRLSPLGFQVVRHLMDEKEKKYRETLAKIAQSGGLLSPRQPANRPLGLAAIDANPKGLMGGLRGLEEANSRTIPPKKK